MFWFVNPINSTQAVNLAKVKSIELDKRNIFFDSVLWIFKSEVQAKGIYESLIKEAQMYRYKKVLG